MKKNSLLTAVVSASMVFVIAGCSDSQNSAQTSTSNGSAATASGNTTNGSSTNGNTANGNNPAFQQPDVYGEVATIDGSKVTLKLLETPTRPNRQDTGNGNAPGTANDSQNGNASGNANGTQNGNTPGNGQGQGKGYGGGRGGFMAQKQYTGKEKTITIPDGTAITTMTRGENGMTQSTISIDQITKGSVLSVYYKTDGKTIDSIRVQQPVTDNQQQPSGNTNSNTNTNTNI